MARINEHPNMLAFLDMLAWAEGTSTHPHTKDDGYNVIVNGDDGDPRPNIMTSYALHPNVLVKVNVNLKSTVADLFIGGAIAPPPVFDYLSTLVVSLRLYQFSQHGV
ncbi:hypothetical protein [Plesiomonas shigelloides]|uniref:hypothetical protein n=1 Tax=Plesiomonas shigelloides TaxID=703 RepID=UPI0012614104|nr:hypothetical protein GBN16_14080 [Plesiomonas shigelloides]